MIGVIGVSGNTPREDEEIAKAGAAAFNAASASAESSNIQRSSDQSKIATDDWITTRKPDVVIDLATKEGVQVVKGTWRYSDTKIIDVEFKAASPDGQPSTISNRAYDFAAHAGGTDIDDGKWEVIEPTSLDKRRSAGRLAFNWYRLNITVPERIGSFDPTGTTAVFSTSLDDYAEIWIDGELARAPGQSGGSVIKGWNAENRLIAGRNLKPGQKIQIAIFGINGPISNPPTNYIYIRSAKLEFHKVAPGPVALTPQRVDVEVVRSRSGDRCDRPGESKNLQARGGIPVHRRSSLRPKPGYLLFSDPNANPDKFTAARPRRGSTDRVSKRTSGYSGKDVAEYGQPDRTD